MLFLHLLRFFNYLLRPIGLPLPKGVYLIDMLCYLSVFRYRLRDVLYTVLFEPHVHCEVLVLTLHKNCLSFVPLKLYRSVPTYRLILLGYSKYLYTYWPPPLLLRVMFLGFKLLNHFRRFRCSLVFNSYLLYVFRLL